MRAIREVREKLDTVGEKQCTRKREALEEKYIQTRRKSVDRLDIKVQHEKK